MTCKHVLKQLVARLGYELKRLPGQGRHTNSTPAASHAGVAYVERSEYGPSNIETKLQLAAKGLPFESPDIVNLNHAVASLIGDAKRIVELGAGTGTFAAKAAEDASRFILASEFDQATHEWAAANRSHPNIRYQLGPVPPDTEPFDLLVAIEVIEHVAAYQEFLAECTRLAPRALITTPNRARGHHYYHAGPPPYFKHVREWTAGEFYWVLRCFYARVNLYGMTSQTEPTFVLIDVDTRLSPLVAECRDPHVRS